MMQAFLGIKDTGPTECILTNVLTMGPPQPRPIDMLKFSEALVDKSATLNLLMSEWEALEMSQNQRSSFVRRSVVKWIHYANWLELCGYEEEEDTKRDLTRGSGPTTRVLRTYQLIKDNYRNDSALLKHIFDASLIKKWHIVLMDGLFQNPGHFRRVGVETLIASDTADTASKHIYPHHDIVESCIHDLGSIVIDSARYLDSSKLSRIEKIQFTFALAAFAQLHFFDIHPFEDGNGLISRFISKYILDSVCSMPFPMFGNRSVYLDALKSSRKCNNPLDAPKELMNLLLDEAIRHYSDCIQEFSNISFDMICIVSDLDALKARFQALDLIEDPILITKWEELDGGASVIVEAVIRSLTKRTRVKLVKYVPYIPLSQLEDL